MIYFEDGANENCWWIELYQREWIKDDFKVCCCLKQVLRKRFWTWRVSDIRYFRRMLVGSWVWSANIWEELWAEVIKLELISMQVILKVMWLYEIIREWRLMQKRTRSEPRNTPTLGAVEKRMLLLRRLKKRGQCYRRNAQVRVVSWKLGEEPCIEEDRLTDCVKYCW